MPKRGTFIGDLHSGSMYAPIPPSFETYDGLTINPNPGQEYLWKCWDDFTWRVHRFDPDFIVVNGDCIEGPQRKSNGYEVSLISGDDQVKCCLAVLNYLKARVRQDCKWYFTKGTPYHVGDFDGSEESIAKQVGGCAYPSVGTGKYCREVLWAQDDGVVIEVAHHTTGGATGFYRMTPLDREAQWAAMAAKDASKGIPKVDLHVRSHLHYYGRVEHDSKEVLLLPCWKLGDRHSRKGGLHRFYPTIGGVNIVLDGDAKREGHAPCHIDLEKYSLPPVKIVDL